MSLEARKSICVQPLHLHIADILTVWVPLASSLAFLCLSTPSSSFATMFRDALLQLS